MFKAKEPALLTTITASGKGTYGIVVFQYWSDVAAGQAVYCWRSAGWLSATESWLEYVLERPIY